ncbi:hypothetical protein OF83DRAFT_240619 [Amylostereum chailletii]|nr:hypothetical protein OF83DRAFT_240619 [Amylostereum chailletii]
MPDTQDSKSKKETEAAGKRKLSASAASGPLDTQIKRSKSGSETIGELATAATVPTSKEPDADGDGDGNGASKKPPSDGIDTFYLWDEALQPMLEDGEVVEGALRLKSVVLEAWAKIKHLPEEEQNNFIQGDEDDESESTFLEGVSMAQWFIEMEEGSHETDAGKRLRELYEVKSKEKSTWWWELDLQRKEPEEGAAALAIKLQRVLGLGDDEVDERDGKWWVVGLRAADEDGKKAMTLFTDYLAADID